jgi:outer membrane protein assembly factor BamE (lipoprotein component of BamABCDE complex)
MKHLFILAAVTSLLVGCVSSGRPINQTKVRQIQKGVSTRSDVELLLGKPTSVTETDGAIGKTTTLTYMHISANATPESFIPYVGLFVSGAESKAQSVIIVFDGDGKVKDISNFVSQDRINTGLFNAQLSDSPPKKPVDSKSGKR